MASIEERGRGQEGFSLIEVIIVTVILVVILGSVLEVLSVGLGTFNTGSVLTEIQAQARRVIDDVAKELQQAGMSTISPTPPATGTDGTTTITFQTCVGYSGGANVWSDVTTIEFAYEAGETDDGADNNNNGLIDEGVVQRTVVDGAGVSTTEILGHWVKEDGLRFNMDGDLLTISIEMHKKVVEGDIMETELATAVLIKND